MKAVAVLVLLGAWAWPQAGQPTSSRTTHGGEEQVRELINSLPPNSQWLNMLRGGMRGDGIHHPWMDRMKDNAVKLAIFTYEFSWTAGGRKLQDWTLVSEQYFRDYDESQRVTEPEQLDSFMKDGLQEELAAAVLPIAKNGNWLEQPPELCGEGYRLVYLADNEWLPVNLPPLFGQYEPGTTPLMHAAILGDSARIKRLLAEGTPVDATSPDGMTALMYAASSRNAVAVEVLLSAGADAKRKTKAGDTTLMNAAASGDLRSVSLLLKAGVDPNSLDAQGQSALSMATWRHYADVAKLLQQAGARR